MIVADTHVLIWMLEGSAQLGEEARLLFDETVHTSQVFVSAITPWEIALLSDKGRLTLEKDVGVWIDEALDIPGIRLTPLEPGIAVGSVRLPGAFHADPADRMIVATARFLGAPLLTADSAILEYGGAGHVRVIDAAR